MELIGIIAGIFTILGTIIAAWPIYNHYSNKKQKEIPETQIKPTIDDNKLSNKIDITKLPNTDAQVFGREKELKILDNAWNDSKTKIISFIAMGGVGKSALVNAWVNEIQEQDFRGADLVYGWSFYSQGTKEGTQASSDEFINQAFEFFGKTSLPDSQHEKGKLLAQIISQKRVLLILDGLEPLQYAPGQMHGYLKDQAMSGFFKTLARCNKGLCIITSRAKVEDLKSTQGKASLNHALDNLSKEAGKQVLRNHEIKGTDKELEQVSEDFKGHALALNLLGSYLKTAHNCDIKRRDKIANLTQEERYGGHAKRVMESYVKWFEKENTQELEILFMLGLFDRPAQKQAMTRLTGLSGFTGFKEEGDLSSEKSQTAIQHLRELRLIAKTDEKNPDILDCHPLVREYFGEKLEKENPKAWKQANQRLYEYYKSIPEKEFPDTLEEMEPLFAAVKHGCLAGKHQEAEREVYWKRIKRENQHYSTAKLGAFGSDLACLSCFFESIWDKPASNLTENVKAVVLSWAGFGLRAVSRLNEAVQPMKAGLEMRVKDKKWKNAAMVASNLSQLMLLTGDVKQGVKYGKESVEFADKSNDGFQMESKRTCLADAYHQTGELNKAQDLFIEAENMQKKRQPEYDYLYSLQGFQYCDLLISFHKYKQALKRAQTTLEWVRHTNWILDIALDNLTIGKALMLINIEKKSEDFSKAENYLNIAVQGLRESGNQDDLPRGLFARSSLYTYQKRFLDSWTDLDEAFEIAKYGNMKLYLVDYYLESCRNIKKQLETCASSDSSFPRSTWECSRDAPRPLLESMNEGARFTIIENTETLTLSKDQMQEKFKNNLQKAKELVKETGYFRRNAELKELSEP